jgi:hypothetical protein
MCFSGTATIDFAVLFVGRDGGNNLIRGRTLPTFANGEHDSDVKILLGQKQQAARTARDQ